jgi:hypothetical protein
MIGLSVLRTFSHVRARLVVRQGGGGQPTDGWQDKSAAVRLGASGCLDKAILPSLGTPLPALRFGAPTISTRSAPSPNRRSGEQP